ncbi:hypothetical protein H0H93_016367 [Arthromyces matolae]|nr:hypothetical protein H0H93_016367 [Arthromyces matolae]
MVCQYRTFEPGEQFVNADGFGITWYTDARSQFNPYPLTVTANVDEEEQKKLIGKPHIYDGPLLPFVRGPHPAMYKTTIAKPCIFAHLRAAGFPPVATTNNHPFVFGRHSFMHNGGISDFGEIRKEMLTHVSSAFAAMIEGGTDTEHLAAIYMTNLCEPQNSWGADKHYPAASMWKALKSAIETVEAIQKQHGKEPANYLNIGATDGESLVALCYSNATSPIELWLSVGVADILNRKPHALSSGGIFHENRPISQLQGLADRIKRSAKPVIRRDANKHIIGQFLLLL